MTPQEHLKAHQQAGRLIDVGGVQTFIREEGSGPPVVCLHGVPTSSYLYRKVLPELATRGLRGIAPDFPGMGLSDRPLNFDYSFTGLGRWAAQLIEALALDQFHLVIHDIGGPVGLELVAARPHQIQSLTILNTLLANVGTFKKPWPMRPFEWPVVGELYLATMQPALFTRLMVMLGVNDKSSLPPAEGAVYVKLLKRQDNGRAFLKIMRSFETTVAKQELYISAVKNLNVPVQFVWGEDDPFLTVEKDGRPAAQATGVERFFSLPSKHFLQEDQAPAIAALIADLVNEGL